ncbi:MAG: hypothetical protein K2I12_03040 [Duncaniella sp.]|nr:hypothetical protein [Duncaniella sp.]
MKKILTTKRPFTFPALLLILTLIGLTSCAADDPYYDYSPIVGGWYLVDSPGVIYNEFEFYSDGSGLYYADDGYGSEYIEWVTYGNQLTVYLASETWDFDWAIRGGYLYLYPYAGGPTMVYAPM